MSLTSEASVTSAAEEVPAGPPSTVKVQPSRATAGFSGRLGRLAEGWAFLCVLEARINRSDPQAAHGVAYEVRRHTLRVEPDAQPDPHRRNGRPRAPISCVAGRAAHGVDAGASAPPSILRPRAYRCPNGCAPMCSRQPPTPCAHSARALACSSGAAALLGRAPSVDVAQEVDAAQAACARHVRRQARRRVGVESLGRGRVSWVGRVPLTLGGVGRAQV